MESTGEVQDLVLFYKGLYEKELELRRKLEDECDLLASDNVRLTSEMENLRQSLSIPLSTVSALDAVDIDVDILVDGGSHYPNHPNKIISGACDKKNVISVQSCNEFSGILCAGADNSIFCYSLSGERTWSSKLSAPITSIVSFRQLSICGCFDGTITMVFLFLSLNVP